MHYLRQIGGVFIVRHWMMSSVSLRILPLKDVAISEGVDGSICSREGGRK
jgi:hypothetical protein